jgi:gamma-glutamylcyclotransferase (GGCT)/AIG2-like uncharacterized protein YtfP
MESRLFVYGTLRRGESASHLLDGGKFVGQASIRGRVIHSSGYPGLVGGEEVVPGELYELQAAMFEALDRYEGPGYLRKLSDVECAGEIVEAWVYWLLS